MCLCKISIQGFLAVVVCVPAVHVHVGRPLLIITASIFEQSPASSCCWQNSSVEQQDVLCVCMHSACRLWCSKELRWASVTACFKVGSVTHTQASQLSYNIIIHVRTYKKIAKGDQKCADNFVYSTIIIRLSMTIVLDLL